jgi:hypothetical protein
MKRILTCIVAVVTGLTLAAGAFAAGGSILSGYGGEGGNSVHAVSPASGTIATPSGTLPFTGLDLSLIVIGALLLVATGILIRRSNRSNNA